MLSNESAFFTFELLVKSRITSDADLIELPVGKFSHVLAAWARQATALTLATNTHMCTMKAGKENV